MTRINSHINPKNLSDEHLLAEHREIKRVPKMLYKSIEKGLFPKIPNKFCLGTGHVTFFYDKMSYLFERYKALHSECLSRGFNVEDYSDSFTIITDNQFWHTWESDQEADNLVINRISERIQNSPKSHFHYYGGHAGKAWLIEKLKENDF